MKMVGRTELKLPKGHLGFVDKKGKAKAVPMRWFKKRGSRRRISLAGDTIDKKEGFLYFLKNAAGKGVKIMEAKMKKGGRRRRGRKGR